MAVFIIFLSNIVLFLITTFLENNVFHRSLVGTYIIYCSYLSVLNRYSDDEYRNFFTSFIILFLVGILFCCILFVVISISPNHIFQGIILFLIYIYLSVLILGRLFRVELNIISIIKLVVSTIISWLIMSSISNIVRYDYGYSLICTLWSLSFTVIIFEKNNFNLIKEKRLKDLNYPTYGILFKIFDIM